MNKTWTITFDGDNVAWITFDLFGEKVNKFNSAAMSDLEAVLDEEEGLGSIVVAPRQAAQ